MANPALVPPYVPPPGNMTLSTVLDTAAGNSVLITNEKLAITGLGETPRLVDVINVVPTAYAAGTLKQVTVDFTANSFTPDTTVPYQFYVQAEGNTWDTAPTIPYLFFSLAATATAMGVALAAVINADPNRIVNATNNSGVVTLVEISLVSGDFQVPNLPMDDSGNQPALITTVPYVRPSGTVTDIAQYTNATLAGTQYTKYVITYRKPNDVNIEGKTMFIVSTFVVFANTAATAYAAANLAFLSLSSQVTQITTISTGVTLNSQRGVITTVASTLASVTPAIIVLTNSTIAVGLLVKVHVVGGTWTAGCPVVAAQAAGAGSISITLSNAGTAALNGTVVILFEVVANS